MTRLLAFAAGGFAVFAFAPFALPPVTLAALALLFWLWQGASTARDGAWLGFAFGCGLFGFGVSWVYIALETFGGMPMPVAIVATAGFVAYLALWPALAGWVVVRFTRTDSFARLVAAAAAWTLCEWLRGYVFSGFPWLSVGYAELLPGGMLPLAGYAPLGGVFLVSLAVALCAAAVAAIIGALASARLLSVVACLAGITAIVGVGAALTRIEWTTPLGSPVAVSLIQGNVSQAQKFDPEFRPRNYELYEDLVRISKGRLVVLPESAFPQFADEIPGSVFLRLATAARARDGSVLVGLFIADPPLAAGEGERIYNSVVSLGAAAPQLYRKHHLVPFGERIPLKPLTSWFINSVLAIPLADQAAGPAQQPPFDVAGQKVAVNICYEDVFGAELIGAARAATLLVNVTNDAWYGRSIAARQHNQIAAMRALETGRPMLRATNTGITSAIAHDGRVLAELPWFVAGVLEVEIAGRTGDTPYLRFGDAPALALASVLLLAAGTLARRRPGSSAG
ncbi:MAG: apolipoprotein N-acyltransferase [Betaproteobacteria bacterium]